jgi:hypothetical protein
MHQVRYFLAVAQKLNFSRSGGKPGHESVHRSSKFGTFPSLRSARVRSCPCKDKSRSRTR